MYKPKKERLPSWDLSQYYTSFDDPSIVLDIEQAKLLVTTFRSKYRGKVCKLSANEILDAIKNLESLSILLYKPSRYFNLLNKGGVLVDVSAQMKLTQIENTIAELSGGFLFWEIELSTRKDLKELCNNKLLSEYSNYLFAIFENAPHRLAEDVEKALEFQVEATSNSLSDLYRSMSDFAITDCDFGGEIGSDYFSLNDLSFMAQNRSRAVRKKATSLMNSGYRYHEVLYLQIYNNILLNHKINNTLYKFDSPEDPDLLNNQVSHVFLETLISCLKENVGIYRDYINLNDDGL
jgi:oligoendopeptidase F